MDVPELPVVVIGAGSQGLAAAAHLQERHQPVVVLEQGPGPATAVREWGHVRLFSEWDELIDPAARRLLETTGWSAPAPGHPTGNEWVDAYLAPLATALGGDVVRYRTRVTGVARTGRDLLVSSDRDAQPFTIHTIDEHDHETTLHARAVLDASGTWGTPNPAGAEGLPALGERALRRFISHQIPNPADTSAHVGRHTVVVGSGASAFNALAVLARAADRDPDTRITWIMRRPVSTGSFGGGDGDQLPERGALGVRAKELVDSGVVQLLPGFRTRELRERGSQVELLADDGRTTEPADHVVVLTGFRPDLSFLSEIRLDLDPVLQAPRLLAAEVDPNLHSCGSVRATGAAELAQPENNFFLIGAKSYGRAPTFLALTGYEQVRSISAWLSGDPEAAAGVELVLPDTGVCGGAGLYDDPDTTAGGCCAPTAPTEPVPAADRSTLALTPVAEENTSGCC